ncbi:uncharacterized protein LOC144195581 isoform X2 [Stigmatopora nigra]
MAEESAVKVCVRVRPFIEREESDSSEPVEVFWEAKENIVRQLDDRTSTKSFAFDRVFTAEGTTNQLYQDIAKPLVVSTVEGYNGTIFAYGQTASGKTFTMMGSDMNPGIIPLAVDDVFRTIKKCPKKEFLLRVSYMEIYNETVTDLLVDSWKRKPLEVRETINKNIYVADLTEELVTSPAQALAWIRKGEKNRHYGSTKMNHRSSRSHAIFRMILESRERTDLASGENADGAIIVSHLNLVDLAGSERTSQTRAEGARLKEGCNINSSLFTLGQVIKKLSEESQRNFINYRDSKLTRILQNSLGGNAKTVILCMITTASLDETLGTLQFASAAKKMKNDPHVTEVSDDGALLKRYRNEIVDLKKRLQEVSSVTQTTATEKEELFQILQEKQQLQLEQEDRIRNLTELLVTSNNMTSVQLVPKRRVTWGGKMLRHPMLPIPGTDLPYDSFSESICPRTNAYPSSMEKITEGEFFSNWTFPDEPEPDDTKSCEDFVTLRSSENRVAELELQLQSMDQEKRKALDQIEAMNQEAAEVNLKLQSEAEEKEILASEREYLLQQLDVLRTDAIRKEEEATGLSQKLQEKLELEEFHCLEKMCAKECEIELQNEISLLKNLMDSRELQFLELKNNVDMVSKELKDKTQVADDLQNMCGKDLVEEVANLRHSLDDAQHFGKETKKEWALLRSENIALEEMKMTLTTSDEKMKAEVDSLRKQLETEKSKFKKMQTDLQKELNVVFNENAKLFALCDGKLPKNIMDSVELEMTVTKLKKELEASQQAEGLLSTRLEELGSLQADQNELNNLEKISAEELEKLELAITTITAERDQLKMDLQENIDMVIENQEDLRNSLGEIAALKQRVKQLVGATSEQLEETLQVVSEQKKQLEVELQQFVAEAAENESLLHSLRSQLQEQVLRNNDIESTDQEYRAQLQNQTLKCEQLEATLQTACEEKKQLEAELQQFIDKAAENENLLHSLETRLQEQVQRNNDVESPDQEYQAQLQNQTFKCEQLEATLQMACEEKKQLEAELQQFVDKAAENEDLLRSLETQLQEQVQRNNDIESPDHEYQAQLQNQTLKCEQLEATLQTACEEKKQLEAELQQFIDKAAENENLLHSLETQLQEQVQRNNDIESTDQEYQARLQNQTFKCEQLEASLQMAFEEKKQLEAELQQFIDKAAENENLLHSLETRLQEQILRNNDVESTDQEYQAQLQNQTLKCEQLEATLQTACEEKKQLEAELQQFIDKAAENENLLHSLETQLQEQVQRNNDIESTEQEYQAQLQNQTLKCEQLEATLQTACEEKKQLEAELQQFIDKAAENENLLHSLENQLLEQVQRNKDVESTDQEYQARLQNQTFKCEQLEATLQTACEEKKQLEAELQQFIDKAAGNENLLHSLEIQLQEQILRNNDVESTGQEIKTQLQNEVEDSKILLDSLQSEIRELKNKSCEMAKVSEEKELHLNQDIQFLRMELEAVKEEKERFAMEKLTEHRASMEEIQKLRGKMTSLGEEKDKILDNLEELSQEKSELNAQLEDKIEMVITLKEKLDHVENVQLSEKNSTLEQLTCSMSTLSEERAQLQKKIEELVIEKEHLKSELQDVMGSTQEHTNEKETQLQQEVQQLEELKIEERHAKVQAEAKTSEGLIEAKAFTSSLDENNLNCVQKLPNVTASSGLEMSSLQLQEIFGRFEHFIHTCSSDHPIIRDKILTKECFLNESDAFPQATLKAHGMVIGFGPQNLTLLSHYIGTLLGWARIHKGAFQKLVEDDFSIFEKGRWLDLLRGSSQALSCSVQDLEADPGQGHSLSELLTKRQVYVQKMENTLRCLWAGLDSYREELKAEVKERERFSAQVQEELNKVPLVMSGLDSLFRAESVWRSGVKERRIKFLRGMLDERVAQRQELQQLKSKAECQLQRVKTVRAILQQTLEDTQLEDLFARFEQFIDTCSSAHPMTKDKMLTMECFLNESDPFPHATLKAHSIVIGFGPRNLRPLFHIIRILPQWARLQKMTFQKLVENDVAIFEEGRLQDLLRCRSQAISCSVQDLDADPGQGHRLNELLKRRQLYVQKMENTLRYLWASLDSYRDELSTEVHERARFSTQVQQELNRVPLVMSRLDKLFQDESVWRSGVEEKRNKFLQGIIDERVAQHQELQQLKSQAECQLQRVKNMCAILQQTLEDTPTGSEQTLVGDNQHLIQLRQSEEEVKTLKCEQLEATLQTACEEKKQLEAELQQFIDKAAENENLLHSLETQLQEQVQRNNDIESTEQEYQAQLQNQTLKCEQLEATLQTACEEKKQLEAELQQFIDKAAENENLLHSLENQLLEQVQRNKDVESTDQEYQARLQNQTFKCEQLEATLQTACEEKKQLEAELQQFIDKAAGNENLLHSLEIQLQEQILRNNDVESTGQEIKTQLQNEVEDSKILLDSLQSEIRELKNKSCEMAKVSEEKELHLNQDIQFLRMELEAVKEEKERFAMEKLTEHRASMEEIQKLRGKMTSLGEEKDKILDNLEELSQEKSELNAQLEDKIEMVITLKEKLDHVENVQLSEKNSTLEQLTCSMSTLSEERAQLQKKIEELVIEKEHLKSELQDVMGSTQEHTNEKETQLQQEVQQLEELKIEERHAKVQAEAKTSEGLIEAKAFTSSLDENNLNCVQKLPNVTASSGLEMSSLQLQEIFGRFEHFIHTCSSDHPIIRDKILTKECFLNESDAFPQATLKAHGMVIGFGPQNLTLLSHYIGTLLGWARIHKGAFQKLVEDDFSIFEKGRWLDLLRGSSQALSCSVQDLEADPGQGHSLSELLTKRQVYVQKMENTLRCLWAGLDSYREELKAEVKERERFSAQVQEELNKVPLVMSGLDSLFRAESVWRSGVKERRIKFLRGMLDERVAQRQELQQLKSKAECQLQRVKTVRAILQQTLEDTQLEDLFARFEQFIDTCSSAHPMTKDKMLTMECFLNESDPFPHATLKAHSIVIGFGPRNLRPLFHIIRILPQWARLQKMTFQKLVENDVAIFEEGRLQDLLRCRSQAISCSVQDLDADPGQGHRLNELLKRRQLYVQKMENTLRYLWASLDSYRDELSTEVHERARFSTQVQQELNRVPLVMSRLDKLFQDESVWRSGVEEKRNKFLQGIIDERVAQHQELQQLKSQAECQLQRVKNMCAILQQTLEDTPTGSEQTLVGDNQHLIQLRQSEEEVKVLCAKIKQLEEDLVQANDSDSKSKMATQELQTMLLTNQAQVEELKNVIKDLMTQLETPEAAELQKVQAQLFKMEMELRAAVDEHQKE